MSKRPDTCGGQNGLAEDGCGKTADGQRPVPHCLLCEGTAARRLVTKGGYNVVRCTDCGLVYVWPQPTPAALEAHYSAPDYHAAADEDERRRYFATRLRQIEERGPRRGRLLDVGCSKGLFLDVARAGGWDAVGIDLNRKAVAEAQARGLDVRHGELDEGTFEAESFDVVTLFDLIEHVREPRRLLAACHRALRPSGFLTVTTPDISGLVPRVTYVVFALTLGAWEHPTPPAHLSQFSRRTLAQMLELCGFTAVLTRREHVPLRYSVGKLENSILDVLAGRHRTVRQDHGALSVSEGSKPAPISTHSEGASEPSRDASACQGSSATQSRKSSSKKAFRACVRALGWAVIGAAGLVARATRWGDSMLVMAQRPP